MYTIMSTDKEEKYRFDRVWKCNQALIMGFGDNDHAIRKLMRFIEITSREFIFEDVTRNGGAPNYKCDGFKLKGGLNSFIFRIWV